MNTSLSHEQVAEIKNGEFYQHKHPNRQERRQLLQSSNGNKVKQFVPASIVIKNGNPVYVPSKNIFHSKQVIALARLNVVTK